MSIHYVVFSEDRGGTEFVSLDIDPVGHEGTIFRFAGSVYAVNETNQPDAVLQRGETA